MKITKKQKQGAGLLLSFLLPLFTAACPTNGPKEEECECPPGTNHPNAPCNCGGKNCACTNNPIENPELREATINLNFGSISPTATVKGELTASQWEGLVTRIETVIQNSWGIATRDQREAFVGVFQYDSVVIVVEKNAAFNQWSISNRYLIHFNFNYLAGKSDAELATTFLDVIIMEMNEAPFPEVAKANAQ